MLSVFPAPAGINRRAGRVPDIADRVPRASGDKPQLMIRYQGIYPCSPRQRG